MTPLKQLSATVLLSTVCWALNSSSAAPEIEWVTIRPPFDGNSLTITALDPLAGTPIFRERPVTFTLTIDYVLQSAPKGRIVLVVQDEHTHHLVPKHPQLKHEIVKGSGTVTLTDTITIKHYAKMAKMFVVLLPEGVKSVDAAAILQWPIVRPK